MAPGATVLVVQEGLGKVVEFAAANPAIRKEITVGDKPHEIALARDGKTAYVSNFGLLEANLKIGVAGKTISVIDVAQGVEHERFALPAGNLAAPHGIKLRPPHKTELFTNAEEGDTMVVFDAASGRLIRAFPLPPQVHNFIFSRDGSALVAFSMAGAVFRIDSNSGYVEAQRSVQSPRGLAWTADRSALIVSSHGELAFLEPSTLAILKRFSNLPAGQIFYPTPSPDGRFIFAPAVLDGAVLVIDAVGGEVIRHLETGSPLSVTMSVDGRKAWISNVLVPRTMLGPDALPRPGGVTELNLETFAANEIPGTADANGLAVSAIPISI